MPKKRHLLALFPRRHDRGLELRQALRTARALLAVARERALDALELLAQALILALELDHEGPPTDGALGQLDVSTAHPAGVGSKCSLCCSVRPSVGESTGSPPGLKRVVTIFASMAAILAASLRTGPGRRDVSGSSGATLGPWKS